MPAMIIFYCLRRSYIRCVDDFAITLRYRPCGGLQYLFRCTNTRLAINKTLSSYNAPTCLTNFIFTTSPFPRLSCSVLLFFCMPCPQMSFLHCLRRSNICCVDDLAISFKYRYCNASNYYSIANITLATSRQLMTLDFVIMRSRIPGTYMFVKLNKKSGDHHFTLVLFTSILYSLR